MTAILKCENCEDCPFYINCECGLGIKEREQNERPD